MHLKMVTLDISKVLLLVSLIVHTQTIYCASVITDVCYNCTYDMMAMTDKKYDKTYEHNVCNSSSSRSFGLCILLMSSHYFFSQYKWQQLAHSLCLTNTNVH